MEDNAYIDYLSQQGPSLVRTMYHKIHLSDEKIKDLKAKDHDSKRNIKGLINKNEKMTDTLKTMNYCLATT
jgi:hypothetical protein